MLQLAIWGIALLLAVKGFDILHRQTSARSRGEIGAPALTQVTVAVAFVSAAGLAFLASNARSSPELRGLVTYERHDEALEAAERLSQSLQSGEYKLNEQAPLERALEKTK